MAFVTLMVLAGADAISVFIRSSLVPLATPDVMRGRVIAVENVFIGGSNELGALESGIVAHFLGLVGAVVTGGIGTLVVVAVWWNLFPKLRDIDTFDDARYEKPAVGSSEPIDVERSGSPASPPGLRPRARSPSPPGSLRSLGRPGGAAVQPHLLRRAARRRRCLEFAAMRFIGFQSPDGPSIGVVAGDEVRRLCSIDDFYAEPAAWLGAEPDGPATALASVTQLPPVPVTSKILCLGLNYQAHVDETGRQRPKAPDVFGRWYTTLNVDGGSLSVPSGEPGLDWEGELAAIIGAVLVDTPASEAMEGVLGYTCFNDVSARTYQRAGTQFTLGKNPDGSGPIGPSVVTADELGDPYGRTLQTASTAR